MNFLMDKEFLKQINQYHIRNYRAEIKALDFETEKVLAVLDTKVVSGNLSIAANSSVRRTGSLSLIADDTTMKITDINNIIAIDKKIALSIGFDNPLYHLEEYQKYGKILWFNQGVFFITSASASFSTGGTSISLSFIDKMGKLNGTCGGILLASTSFHDRIEYDKEGNKKTTYPLIADIIKECVHHFGEEHYTRIIVEDIDEYGRIQVNYNGDDPIRFTPKVESDGSANQEFGRSFVIRQEAVENDGFSDVYYKGDPIGYVETDLTYPGELIVNAGATIESVLNTIAKTLGNFEYFYDTDGNFHFRKIKDFQMTGIVPLNWSDDAGVNKDLWQSYLPRYSNTTHIDEFVNTSLVTQISYSPKYENIKNDFVVWGTLNDNGNVNNNTAVRYHLAIDRRPKDIKKPDGNSQAFYTIGENYSLCHKQIYKIVNADTDELLRYQTSNFTNSGEKAVLEWDSLDNYHSSNTHIPTFDWREELYRQALIAYGSSVRGSYYDEELMAEWRDIFDPSNQDFKKDWETSVIKNSDSPQWSGYNPNIVLAPHKIRYWLDIIDTPSQLGMFSVQRIGRRTQVSENSNIKAVFALEMPDLVFCTNTGDNIQEKTAYYNDIGQDYVFITPDQESLFKKVNSYGTCYDEIRALLMNSLIYNNSVNLSCIPIFYLDVNEIVHLNFSELGIVGDYVIKNISWSLGNSNTMSLTLNEANIII